MENIEDFIEEFKALHKSEIEDLFLNGYCYYFAIILDERFFKAGEIMYIPVYNHFCYKLHGGLYDISGKITDEEKIHLVEPWEEYQKQDYLESERIYRDCILKIPVDIS